MTVTQIKSVKLISEYWGGEQKVGWGAENKIGGDREGLTIRAQRAHFTHTSSKPMEFVLVAVEQGKREGGGEKRL